MSPSTASETPATVSDDTNDLAEFGIPRPNIVRISVQSIPGTGVYHPYHGIAPSGLAIPNPGDPKKLALFGLHGVYGVLQVGTVYAVTYEPVGDQIAIVKKRARYTGSNPFAAFFEVVG